MHNLIGSGEVSGMGFNQLGFSLHLRTASANLPLRARLSAESVGFEPTEPLGSTVFKTAAIDHSANLPIAPYSNTLLYQS